MSLDLVEINTEIGNQEKRPQYRDEEYLKENISETVGLGIDIIQSLAPMNMIL